MYIFQLVMESIKEKKTDEVEENNAWRVNEYPTIKSGEFDKSHAY